MVILLDKDDEEFLADLLDETETLYLETIQPRLKEIMKECIQTYLYDVYEPNTYERTYRLLNSVTSYFDKENKTLYIRPETQDGMYFSVVDGKDVSENIPDWVMVTGHNDNSEIMNEYHHYQARNVLEMTKKRMEEEFPDIKVDIEVNENL